MFYNIHRGIKFLLLCVWLGVAWKIYEHREMFEPAIIWFDVWDNGGFETPPVDTVNGRVLRVVNSQTFIFEPAKGSPVNVRLMGLREPVTEISIASQEKEKARKEELENLILGKEVKVELLYQNANNVGGIVFVDGTNNVQANLVLNGYAVTSKDRIKGIPKQDQYTMLWAQRHRTRIF
jgi:endonuclease YncB( thermonuclease family)